MSWRTVLQDVNLRFRVDYISGTHCFSVIYANDTINQILPTTLALRFYRRLCGSSVNYLSDVVGPKATKFGEITQNNAIQGHLRSPLSVPIESA